MIKAKDEYNDLLLINVLLMMTTCSKRLKMHKIILFKSFHPNQVDELGLIDDPYPMMMEFNLKISQALFTKRFKQVII